MITRNYEKVCYSKYGWRRYCRISDIEEASENNDKELKDKLHTMSIEEIMSDGGFSREVATAIYEAEHGIDMIDMSIEEFFRELDK